MNRRDDRPSGEPSNRELTAGHAVLAQINRAPQLPAFPYGLGEHPDASEPGGHPSERLVAAN